MRISNETKVKGRTAQLFEQHLSYSKGSVVKLIKVKH